MMQAKWKAVCSLALSVTINHNLSYAVDSFKDYSMLYICTVPRHRRNHKSAPFWIYSQPTHSACSHACARISREFPSDPFLPPPGDTWKRFAESNQQPEIIQCDNVAIVLLWFYVGIFHIIRTYLIKASAVKVGESSGQPPVQQRCVEINEVKSNIVSSSSVVAAHFSTGAFSSRFISNWQPILNMQSTCHISPT